MFSRFVRVRVSMMSLLYAPYILLKKNLIALATDTVQKKQWSIASVRADTCQRRAADVLSVAVRCSALQCVAVRGSAWQCVAVRGSALQCVAVHCSALQCVAVR